MTRIFFYSYKSEKKHRFKLVIVYRICFFEHNKTKGHSERLHNANTSASLMNGRLNEHYVRFHSILQNGDIYCKVFYL